MEAVADWYSRNLASETSKGKKERGRQGFHNNRAPFGMKKGKGRVLVADEDELPGLVMAFEAYATGEYSDTGIARMLNEAGYRSKTGCPFSKETVRDMLQNRTYLGYVRYQEYRRNADGSRSYAAPVQWFEGQHDPVIDEDLFERCQEARARRRVHRQATPKYNPYLLRNLVYCHRCCSEPPEGETFHNYGKMRPQAQKEGMWRYYRCRARELGYTCEQGGVPVETIDTQVVSILMQLKPPADWKQGITRAMSEFLREQNLEERLDEIRAAIERMDFRWDHGFITDEREYMDKRVQLQQELEQLTPVADDDLQRAVDMLENFKEHWEAREGDPEAQHELVRLIVERVYVRDDQVVAMTLRSNYHLVLGHNVNGPTEMSVDPFVYTHGSDGRRILLVKSVLLFRDQGRFEARLKCLALIIEPITLTTRIPCLHPRPRCHHTFQYPLRMFSDWNAGQCD
jgi:site-specific DNA recombinase